MLDALGHAHVRPAAAAFVIGLNRSIQGGEGGVGVKQRCTAQNHLVLFIALFEPDRTAHGSQGPVPLPEFAIDEVIALFQWRAEAPGFGDLFGGRKQRIEQTVHGYCTSQVWLGETLQRPSMHPPQEKHQSGSTLASLRRYRINRPPIAGP